MPINPWLAIDTATALSERAHELRAAWERFLDGDGPADVRAPIAESWQRSVSAGIDPLADRIAPVVADMDDVTARWDMHPLAAAVPLIRDCLGTIADEAEHLIVVSDVDGTLLWVEGNAGVRGDAAEMMNFVEGGSWSEAGAGTNAIGTALAAEHAVQVFAGEHFNEVVQAWTCSAAPVHDPDSGTIVGIIDLTGPMATAHPHSFTCAVAAAKAAEAYLRCEMYERDARLRSRYGARIGGREQAALVAPSGRVLGDPRDGWLGSERLALPPGGGEIELASGGRLFAEPIGREAGYIVRALEPGAGRRSTLKLRLLGQDRAVIDYNGATAELSRRHTEMLALLAAQPEGMTSKALAADLWGDSGQPSGARVEMHRLRNALPGAIARDAYRLTANVESDVAHLRALLARGAIREAAEHYHGPLLPHSEAPGIVRGREALEAWLRQAVMTAGDCEAVWAWVQSPSGSDDLPAWKCLLRDLSFRDPRRSLAAARVRALRESYLPRR